MPVKKKPMVVGKYQPCPSCGLPVAILAKECSECGQDNRDPRNRDQRPDPRTQGPL